MALHRKEVQRKIDQADPLLLLCDRDRLRGILNAINAVNPGLQLEITNSIASFDENGHLANLFLFGRGIHNLPRGFGQNLTLGGDLLLNINQLASLPEGFGQNLTLGGNLQLNRNQLASLPDRFGQNLTLAGCLMVRGRPPIPNFFCFPCRSYNLNL